MGAFLNSDKTFGELMFQSMEVCAVGKCSLRASLVFPRSSAYTPRREASADRFESRRRRRRKCSLIINSWGLLANWLHDYASATVG